MDKFLIFGVIVFFGEETMSIGVLEHLIPQTSSPQRHYGRNALTDDKYFEKQFINPFPLGKRKYKRMFMSANGEVTFNRPPEDIKTEFENCSSALWDSGIMVYLADANNELARDSAKFIYSVDHQNKTLSRLITQDIVKAFPMHAGITLTSVHVMIWKDMPFDGATAECNGIEKKNTFQLILASNDKLSFALMSFGKLMWSSARNEKSGGNCHGIGGIGAKVGILVTHPTQVEKFDLGPDWYFAPDSCTDEIINIANTTNVDGGEPGFWIFRLSPSLVTEGCTEKSNFNQQKLFLEPKKVNWRGGLLLKLDGPCIHSGFTEILCRFEGIDEEIRGNVFHDQATGLKSVFCRVPRFNRIGRIEVRLKVHYKRSRVRKYKGHLHVMDDDILEPANNLDVSLGKPQNVSDKKHFVVNLTWNKNLFDQVSYSTKSPPNLQLVMESYQDLKWSDVGVVQDSIPNTGSFEALIPIESFDKLTGNNLQNEWMGLISPNNVEVVGMYLRPEGSTAMNGLRIVADALSLYLEYAKYIPLVKLAKFFSGVSTYSKAACAAWLVYDKFIKNEQKSLQTPACPPTERLARLDSNFENWNGWYKNLVHPRKSTVYRLTSTTNSRFVNGGSSNCVYDNGGNIITGPAAGMGFHRFSPTQDIGNFIAQDLLPYVACCTLGDYTGYTKFKSKTTSHKDLDPEGESVGEWMMSKSTDSILDMCDDYHRQRPGDDGSRYTNFRLAFALGDPHITTFDGFQYTFNGVGEFVMVLMQEQSYTPYFELQARCEQYIKPDGTPTDASIFTAFAMYHRPVAYINDRIQIEYVNQTFVVMFNDEILDTVGENDSTDVSRLTIAEWWMSLTVSSAQVTARFLTGFTFKITPGGDRGAINIMGSADELLNNMTVGLMGNCDGDPSNDLVTPAGYSLQDTSDPKEIHEFGMQWLVHKSASLFSYPEGKQYEDYLNPSFVPKFINKTALGNLSVEVKTACAGEGQFECLFDYETTGNKAIAKSTKELVVEFDDKVKTLEEEVKLCTLSALPNVINKQMHVITTNFVPGNGSAIFQCISSTKTHEIVWESICYCNTDSEWDCGGKFREIEAMNCSEFRKCPEPRFPYYGGKINEDNLDLSLGSEFLYTCNDEYEDVWNECGLHQYNLPNTICYRLCNVTYTCVREVFEMPNNLKKHVMRWRGSGAHVRYLECKKDIQTWESGVIWGHFWKSGNFLISRIDNAKPRIISCHTTMQRQKTMLSTMAPFSKPDFIY